MRIGTNKFKQIFKGLKRITLVSFFLFFSLSYSCAADNTVKIGVISDIHFLSEQLMDDGKTINQYSLSSGKNVKDVPAILDKVLGEYMKSDIEVLLISGDLTKDGEKQSHIDLRARLQPLIDKGIRVLVIPGNHDINMPNSLGYSGDKTFPVENISQEAFEEIYFDCGFSSAINRDTASLSYVSKLSDDIWLLAIDDCLYKEYKDKSISGGRISFATEQWILSVLEDAKSNNVTVVGMMHHGLIEHIVYQGFLFPQYLVEDWNRLVGIFADNGLKAVFTGHFHANDITEFISVENNKIYDIETGSLSAYPFPYRFIELSNAGIDVKTENVTGIPNHDDLYQVGKQFLKKAAYQQALQRIKALDKGISQENMSKLADIASEIFILHVRGDEVISDSLRSEIKAIANDMGFPIDLSSDFLQLDFSPADNNVKLSF